MCRRVALLVALLVLAVSDLALAQARIAAYREPPYGACKFVQEQFGATPDKWQEQVLVAVVDPKVRRIGMKACAGPGKTTTEAWVAHYFMGTRCTPGEHPNGFATSINYPNLRANLWKEIAKWQSRSEYMRSAFTVRADRFFANEAPLTWFIDARAWPKTGSADEQGATFSGLHGANVLVLVDESGAIPPTILRAAEQAIGQASDFGLLLQGGNPISLEGMLYEACVRLRDQWHIVTVTGDPDDPNAWVHSPRVGSQSKEWAQEQIDTYGRDNPWVMSYILGQFPPASINALLGVEEMEAAIKRELEPGAYEWAQKRIGIDVARFGDDRTVLFPRQGLRGFRPVVMRHKRSDPVGVDIANRVMSGKAKWGSEVEFIDATGGWAAGARDVLIANGHPPIEVQFASTQTINPRYYNRRAEILWEAALWVRRGGALPYVPELVQEATATTYTHKDGKLLCEPKELVKKRIGVSPDLWDGFATTFGLPDMPNTLERSLQELGIGGRTILSAHAKTEYDPYAGGRS